MISYSITHIFVDEEIYNLWGLKFEKWLLAYIFFHYDISLNTQYS